MPPARKDGGTKCPGVGIVPRLRLRYDPDVAKRAPEGWKATHQRDGVADDLGYEPLSNGDEEVTVDTRKRAWV